MMSPPFQSSRPMRGATSPEHRFLRWRFDFNPRAPCGARRAVAISTTTSQSDFNPRAPCGARPSFHILRDRPEHFNPRAPCGARLYSPTFIDILVNFNPRAPCGARRYVSPSFSAGVAISILAPHAGRDPGSVCHHVIVHLFQSSRPMRGATYL